MLTTFDRGKNEDKPLEIWRLAKRVKNNEKTLKIGKYGKNNENQCS